MVLGDKGKWRALRRPHPVTPTGEEVLVHPAEEKARLDLVRDGLKRFAEALPLTLREVFGAHANPKYRNMERKVLSLLTERGIISKINPTAVGEPARYILKNAQQLVAIVEDDVGLSKVVWPPSESSIPEAPPPAVEPEPAPVSTEGPPPFVAPEAPPTVEEYMAGVLERFAAIAETLNNMHERLASIDKKVSKIYKDLES